MKKFTQQELEEAVEQIQQERDAERRNAQKAAEWLNQQLQMSRSNCVVNINGWGYYSLSVHPIIYDLQLIHETYGPFLEDYFDKLNTLPCVTKTGANLYEVDTPFGKYKIVFQYFDNHCTGY